MSGVSGNDQCRFCHTAVESVGHLVSASQTLLADGHYTACHNKICKYIHWKICKEYKIEVKDKVWDHEPESVTSNRGIIIFYDKIILTGRYIEGGAIRPDIVIWNKEETTAKIIDVTLPTDFGLNRAERQKITKYQELKNNLKNTWELKEIGIISVVVGQQDL
ncbi:uncharacterized protein [Palaemon carinicauda]|uniref:uncharacterized protein n=1 Tax=Palaemon carinicauda TaxID=392227 RepID=UPI0035B5E5F0